MIREKWCNGLEREVHVHIHVQRHSSKINSGKIKSLNDFLF